ncbi:MAG: steroid delta-isomerase, partial [Lutimonas sp.]
LYPIQQKVGRSFQRIPGTDLIGFINYDHEAPEIYSIHPKTNKMKYIVDALEGSEDMAFTNNGTIFMAKGNQVFKFRPEQDKDWVPVIINSGTELKGITRIAISPDGNKLALVAEE